MTDERARGTAGAAPEVDSILRHRLIEFFDIYGVLDEAAKILSLRGPVFARTVADPNLLIGQPFGESVFWQSSADNAKSVETAIRSLSIDSQTRIAVNFRVSAEEIVPLELRILKFFDEESQLPRYVVAGCKTTAASFLSRDALADLLRAADAGSIGLLFWDHQNGGKAYTNRTSNQLFDLNESDELRIDTFLRKVYPDDRDRIGASLNAAVCAGAAFEEEFRLVYLDGSVEWIRAEGRSTLGSDGKPLKTLAVLRKTTNARLAADELERIYEREKRARDEAEMANRAKDFFLAFVSHELRSPLNAILGWSKILLTRDVTDDIRRKALETIEKSAQVQAKLINDLVDSARVASGKLRLEYRPVNIIEIVRSSFEAMRPSAESAGLAYELHSDIENLQILGDSGRLQQVFANLLSNAIKFTPPGGTVSVNISRSAQFVEISVADTGAGIESSMLPDIFKQFAQGRPEHERRSGGLGLGLSIVNILVGKHGGTITAASDGPGRGSRLTVRLPITSTGARLQPTATSYVSTRKLEGIKLLIVEDDPDSREVLQLFLEQNGATVAAAESVRQALSLLDPRAPVRFDLIISDLAMPEEDGYSLIEKIRSEKSNPATSIPVIALSAFTTAESRTRALECGFQRYLTKPFEPEILIREILDLLPDFGRKSSSQV
ncbi:MAG: hybrid sensor histidine kinase/response regulator [Blastocatellia bacterium]